MALDAEGLAGTLICEHKYDEAAPLSQLALKTDERAYGKDHPFVALALNQLGVVALKHGDLDTADGDFRRMDAIYRSAFPEKNKHVALGLLRLGELYEARKEYPRAEQSFRQSVRIYSEALSADNVQTGAARIELGVLLLRERRYKEAEAELLAGYHIVAPGRSPALNAAVEARKDLIELHTAQFRTAP